MGNTEDPQPSNHGLERDPPWALGFLLVSFTNSPPLSLSLSLSHTRLPGSYSMYDYACVRACKCVICTCKFVRSVIEIMTYFKQLYIHKLMGLLMFSKGSWSKGDNWLMINRSFMLSGWLSLVLTRICYSLAGKVKHLLVYRHSEELGVLAYYYYLWKWW